MNTSSEQKPMLDSFIDAARQVDEADIDRATAQFRAGLPKPKPERAGLPNWLRVSGALALLVLAVGLLPVFLPGQAGNQAFARALAWFDQYKTMHLTITMEQDEQTLSTVGVWARASGGTRIEVSSITHIIDPAKNMMHTVLPGGQVMSNEIGINPDAVVQGDDMEWLQELRDFQGHAVKLEDQRFIEGTSAEGWQLTLDQQQHTLWIDPLDQRPLLMEADLPGGLSMQVQFSFNMDLPDSLFKVPAQP